MIALLAMALQAVSPSLVRVDYGAGGFRIAAGPFAKSKLIDVVLAKDAAAQAQCGLTIRHGLFEARETRPSSLHDEPTINLFQQYFQCVDDADWLPATAPIVAGWTADGAEEAAVRAAVTRYWTSGWTGDSATDSVLSALGAIDDPAAQACELREADARRASDGRRITGVRWEVDPLAAPGGAVMAVVHYRTKSRTIAVECGHAILHRLAPGEYRIMWSDETRLQKGASAELTASFESELCLSD